ncbi:hypothetical protein SOVF_043080, partial [Spinacia oleracea]
NNNFIKTLFRSNFPPYGIDLPEEAPPGRFTNGRLPTDFIASYIGVKQYVPAYLDPNLSLEDLTTGVSFGSAGTGYDPLTAERNKVVDMSTQLQYFDEYKKKLQRVVGKKRMEYIIKNAAYVISCGTNDIIYTYGPDFLPLQPDNVANYQQFMLQQCKWFLQAIIDRGARLIGVVPPVGCLPIIITAHSLIHQPRSCIESLSSIAIGYNQILQHELKNMQASQPYTTIAYGEIFAPLQDQIDNPEKYGFEVVDRGCCGTGLIEGAFACNSLSPICDDRSKYLFWDAVHPTERSYYFLFEALRPIVDFILHR